jgi:hypothetical protein
MKNKQIIPLETSKLKLQTLFLKETIRETTYQHPYLEEFAINPTQNPGFVCFERRVERIYISTTERERGKENVVHSNNPSSFMVVARKYQLCIVG